MAEYKLIAKYQGKTKRKTIHAYAQYPMNDEQFDATTAAIAHILNKGVSDPVWGKGEIKLYNPNGEVIHSMEEK